ncbi:RnfABCDGE type electron transport complex subunit G [Pseudomonas sp. PSKL.D1]|uniref:RnfABCDGE type electron transport complex subunit G n=1 Tax=Pseudomonas sp. PSKL.D1 TaxID=3029060 RepID=UPI002381863D|nr:RnfABCDGE type electron transport complex subunit G [Pseudomonas sp. PSKL.D1]WDY59121.1 RnfABCDGE type electron transport complex subunit G [Pseudomonas sp. PSKL.D1]
MKRVARNIAWLLLVAGLSLGVTLLWQQFTQGPATEALQQWKARQFLAVLPATSYDNKPLDTPIPLPTDQPPQSRITAAYRAMQGTAAVAVLFVSEVQGYAAPIRLAIAVRADGRLMGTRVIEQRESPGLGGRITDPQASWLSQFANRGLSDRWALKRDQGDFDQLAGATVTSRAVIVAQQEALRYFDQHRTLLLGTSAHE